MTYVNCWAHFLTEAPFSEHYLLFFQTFIYRLTSPVFMCGLNSKPSPLLCTLEHWPPSSRPTFSNANPLHDHQTYDNLGFHELPPHLAMTLRLRTRICPRSSSYPRTNASPAPRQYKLLCELWVFPLGPSLLVYEVKPLEQIQPFFHSFNKDEWNDDTICTCCMWGTEGGKKTWFLPSWSPVYVCK